MRKRTILAALAAGALAAASEAQTPLVFKAYAQPPEPGIRDSPTDLSLAVSKDRIVLVGNDRFHIADKAGNAKATVGTALPTPLPFVTRLPAGRLFDPRAEYDPVHDRIILTMSENDEAPGANRGAIIHMAISKAGAVPDDFSGASWHIFTGDDAFVLDRDDVLLPDGLDGIADRPSVAVDAGYIYLSIRDSLLFPGMSDVKQQVVAIPFSHSGGNLLDGDRVAETEMSFVNLKAQFPSDESDLHAAVMETTVVSDNVQFVISTDKPPQTACPTPLEAVRLGAIVETSPGSFTYQFRDLAVSGLPTFCSTTGRSPLTPASPGVEYSAPIASKFETAVRNRDHEGNDRIFTVHEYRVDDGGSGANDFITRWYVIDPDAANAGTGAWSPGIVGGGEVPETPQTQVDTFHAALAVNREGRIGLSWTASNAQTHPQLEYGVVNPLLNTLPVSVHVTGPGGAYVDPDLCCGVQSWADYSDIQADPSGCRFFAAGTLVGTTPGMGGTFADRDAWITEIPVNCFVSQLGDFGGDGSTTTGDMLDYLDAYAAGHWSTDQDDDDDVDATDAALYADAYDDQRP